MAFAYSFLDVNVTISGPNGNFPLAGDGAANSEEGCTFAMREEKNTLTVGADGTPMNSLHAGNSGRVTVRLLKTSPVNALLAEMYNGDRLSSLVWGQNLISLRNVASGDIYTCTQCAFARFPSNVWAKDGGTLEWEFDVGVMNPVLAAGIPGLTL